MGNALARRSSATCSKWTEQQPRRKPGAGKATLGGSPWNSSTHTARIAALGLALPSCFWADDYVRNEIVHYPAKSANFTCVAQSAGPAQFTRPPALCLTNHHSGAAAGPPPAAEINVPRASPPPGSTIRPAPASSDRGPCLHEGANAYGRAGRKHQRYTRSCAKRELSQAQILARPCRLLVGNPSSFPDAAKARPDCRDNHGKEPGE